MTSANAKGESYISRHRQTLSSLRYWPLRWCRRHHSRLHRPCKTERVLCQLQPSSTLSPSRRLLESSSSLLSRGLPSRHSHRQTTLASEGELHACRRLDFRHRRCYHSRARWSNAHRPAQYLTHHPSARRRDRRLVHQGGLMRPPPPPPLRSLRREATLKARRQATAAKVLAAVANAQSHEPHSCDGERQSTTRTGPPGRTKPRR